MRFRRSAGEDGSPGLGNLNADAGWSDFFGIQTVHNQRSAAVADAVQNLLQRQGVNVVERFESAPQHLCGIAYAAALARFLVR